MNATQNIEVNGIVSRFSTWLRRVSSRSVLAALLVADLLILLLLFPAAAADGQILPLDLRFGYSIELVYSTFDALGDAGRRRYMIGILSVDLLYPLVYSSLFAVWLTLLLPRDTSVTRVLRLLPFAILIADLLENTSIAIMLAQYPERMEFLARAASIFTASKWSLAAVVVASTLALTARAALRALKPN